MGWKRMERKELRRTPMVLMAALVGFFFLFGGMATAMANDVKIGYVDLHRALENIEEGQQVKRQLEGEFQRRQQQLDQKQQEVMQLREQFEQQAMMLSDEARQQKAMELQQKMGELQQLYMTLQGELAQQEAQATQRIFEKMRGIIAEIGREQSYSMILERTEMSVLYAVESLDLTDELIRRYNAQN